MVEYLPIVREAPGSIPNITERERERHTETETEKQRQTERQRQIDRETETERMNQTRPRKRLSACLPLLCNSFTGKSPNSKLSSR